MKRVLQIRLTGDVNQTMSIVHIMNDDQIVHTCYLLELPWRNNRTSESCIPLGYYTLKKRKAHEAGSRIGYPHLEVLDVYNRSGIKWHVGNYVRELRGCGAPGQALADLDRDGLIDVTSSRKALEALLSYLDNETPLHIIKEM